MTLQRTATLLLVAFGLVACEANEDDVVTVYTSVDRHYSEPVLKAFERRTGIKVRALYDVEAAKTTGLVNKLIAEAQRPRADVFWNGEFLQTELLAQKRVLAPYRPTNLTADHSQDRDHLWTTFGGRARVLIVNTSKLAPDRWPTSVADFQSPRWQGDQLAMAYPLFGTSATHAAALFAAWGAERANGFYRALVDRGVRIVDGNSVVRDLAVSGEIAFGLTDTDDACSAREQGAEVAVVFPDQTDEAFGTLVIPNSVALVAGAPHPGNGGQLIDYLLSEEVMNRLSEAGWFHVSGRHVTAAKVCGLPSTVKAMTVESGVLGQSLTRAKRELRDILVR